MLTVKDLHLYQKRAIAQSIKMEYGYQFLDTGMGKTVISLFIHDQLKKRKLTRGSLVVAPKYVINNVWRQEAKLWDFSKDFTFSTIHGSTYRGTAEHSRRMALMDAVDIHLINYEGLVWLSTYLLRHGNGVPWDSIFYDESTRMKRSTTKRFKAFKRLMSQFRYRFDLTGTPIPNGLEDIFGQAYTVDGGRALGVGNITGFRNKYMVPQYTLHGRVTIYGERSGSRQEVAEKIAPRVIRLKKTEHLKLPPLLYHNIEIDMPPDLRDQYTELEQNFFLEIGGVGVETFSQVATDMKLRQFLQGKIYDAAGVPHMIHAEKLNALRKLTPDLKGNSLIAYNFKYERDDLRLLYDNSPFLDSRTTDKEAEKWITGWNNYEFKQFLVNPASAAFGLNLQAGGNNVIWYSLTYNAEHYSQLIDRLWRQGQRRPVNVVHIVFKDTIDVVIANALSRKDRDQTALMQDIVRYLNGKV